MKNLGLSPTVRFFVKVGGPIFIDVCWFSAQESVLGSSRLLQAHYPRPTGN